jgi:hypothetical protein
MHRREFFAALASTPVLSSALALTIPAEDPRIVHMHAGWRVCSELHHDRRVAFNLRKSLNRIWFSAAGSPWEFGNPDDLCGDWVDVGDPDEPITGTCVIGAELFIVKAESNWEFVGLYPGGRLRRVDYSIQRA